MPFGCEIKYKPITKDDMARCHRYGDKLLPGIFLGYDIQSGGGWSGDLIVADWDEIQEAESFSEIYPKRFKAPEVHPTLKETSDKESYKFLLAEGNLRQPGGFTTEYVRRTRKAPPSEERKTSLKQQRNSQRLKRK